MITFTKRTALLLLIKLNTGDNQLKMTIKSKFSKIKNHKLNQIKNINLTKGKL